MTPYVFKREEEPMTLSGMAKGKRHELLDHSQYDRALRDLMPIIEWLTNADLRRDDGCNDATFHIYLEHVYKEFVLIPDDSPAIKAYMRWLQQNTDEADDAAS
jgi:hypothetical protein